MKINDLKHEIKSRYDNADFIIRCVFDHWPYEIEKYNNVKSIVRKAKSLDDFIELYTTDDRTKFTQGAAELLAHDRNKRWYAIRAAFGDDCRKSWTDDGGLHVVSHGLSMTIPNGYGDGQQRFVILDHEPEYSSLFRHEGFVSFEVTEDNAVTVEGNSISKGLWFAFSYDGLVLVYKARGLI